MALINLPQDWAPDIIIPSSWANNIGDNFTRVDARTGTDPGTPGLFLASNGAVSATWRALGPTDYKDGTIPDLALANAHVYRHDPVPLSFSAAGALGSGFFSLNATSDAPVPATPQWMLIQDRWTNWGIDHRLQIACSLTDVNELYARVIAGGAAGPWRKLWHTGNAGGVVANGITFNGGTTVTTPLVVYQAGATTTGIIYLGNTGGAVYIYNDGTSIHIAGHRVNIPHGLTVGTDFISGGVGTFQSNIIVAGTATISSTLDVSGGTVFRNHVSTSPGVNMAIAGQINAGALVVSGATTVNGDVAHGSNVREVFAQQYGQKILLHANGDHAISTEAPGLINLTTARYVGLHNGAAGPGDWSALFDTQTHYHKFQGTIEVPAMAGAVVNQFAARLHSHEGGGSGGGTIDIPAGIICMWNSGAAPPTGWVFETSFNGRFPFNPGGASGIGFGGTGGTVQHNHGTLSQTLSHSGGSVDGNTANVAGPFNVVTPGTSASQVGHAHGFNQPSNHSVSIATGDASHMPPYYAINFIRKQ